MISHVENVSGQLSYYAYVLNATNSQGAFSFSVTPQNDSLSIVSGAEEFNVDVAFLYSNGQVNSTSEVPSTRIGGWQNFTYSTSDWQSLNSTGIQVTSAPVAHAPTIDFGSTAFILIVVAVVVVIISAVALVARKLTRTRSVSKSTNQVEKQSAGYA
jgi:ABC-type Na+ efflux pump permease subunit